MMKSAKDSIKKYEKGRKEEIDEDFMSFLAVAFLKGVFKSVPDRTDLSTEINENLIIELYSK